MSGDPIITVDPSQPVPPYVQIRDQIADLVSTGGLAAGTRLPTVRQLAADLGLANGTVARAYQELEAAGQLETRRGGGTRVAPQAGGRRAAVVREHAHEFATTMRRLGVTAAEALAAVDQAFELGDSDRKDLTVISVQSE
ncbi:GntR family transcriptional regulator [Asanoa iriomotensis]|uniref:GntR family transcriptional regulator n=1 Tax=Asanoa iriomotensis TaxID=234613 RepID=A0ABQ4BUS7_9ACTN|nr:GntR family transcriptional regulator [Asanoa iriomotensis]GIF54282.1 GntR family transcriptional regulator [Asanoa iriomotensis]